MPIPHSVEDEVRLPPLPRLAKRIVERKRGPSAAIFGHRLKNIFREYQVLLQAAPAGPFDEFSTDYRWSIPATRPWRFRFVHQVLANPAWASRLNSEFCNLEQTHENHPRHSRVGSQRERPAFRIGRHRCLLQTRPPRDVPSPAEIAHPDSGTPYGGVWGQCPAPFPAGRSLLGLQ